MRRREERGCRGRWISSSGVYNRGQAQFTVRSSQWEGSGGPYLRDLTQLRIEGKPGLVRRGGRPGIQQFLAPTDKSPQTPISQKGPSPFARPTPSLPQPCSPIPVPCSLTHDPCRVKPPTAPNLPHLLDSMPNIFRLNFAGYFGPSAHTESKSNSRAGRELTTDH